MRILLCIRNKIRICVNFIEYTQQKSNFYFGKYMEQKSCILNIKELNYIWILAEKQILHFGDLVYHSACITV